MSSKSQNKRVLVAMSGGVDSSVAAALLLQEGYQVEGAFMKCWSEAGGIPCSWEKEREDALRVAHGLGIPFHTFDFEEEYKKRVITHFIEEYRAGRTPNPDVLCNKEIKFGLFSKKAMRMGFDYVATGHYARTDGERLLRAKDTRKDQTYFLYTLSKEILKYTLFPIGEYEKQDVRELARSFDLPTAAKKDSYGVCFVGEFNLKEFLKHYIPEKPGSVYTTDGEQIGTHEGLAFYTNGQRLPIGGNGPYYVVEKDKTRNAIIVTNNAVDERLYPNLLRTESVHWVAGDAPLELPLSVQVKTRYRPETSTATLMKNGKPGTYEVHFKEGERAITPGQSVVFYRGEEVLGGGIIV